MSTSSTGYFIHNNEIHPIHKLPAFHAIYRKKYYYEVIRIVEGVPLFFKDHVKRLKHTIENSGDYFDFSADLLQHGMRKLIQQNQIDHGNCKLVITIGKNHKDFFIQQIPPSYPGKEEYTQGVKVITFRYERSNPTLKIWSNTYKKKTEALKSQHQVYEILLLNKRRQITEGSISNVFFIRDQKIYTAPRHMVLPGITRKHVLKICKQLGVKVKIKPLKNKNIQKIEAAFITGTSPKVLPLQSINNHVLNAQHPVVRSIMEAFDARLNNYIAKHKSAYASGE